MSHKYKKALISCYACEPGKGSEPEVGLRWMYEWAESCDELVMITRANNREPLESCNIPDNVTIEYYDLPKKYLFWKKGRFAIQLYCYLWEILIFFHLKRKYKKHEFDVAQKITLISHRYPSYLHYFGEEFIFGPIAGGERYPVKLTQGFKLSNKLKEIIRMIVLWLPLFDPFVRRTFKKSSKILCANKDTLTMLPNSLQNKAEVKPAIMIDEEDFDSSEMENIDIDNSKLNLLYVGNLQEFKGIGFILESLKEEYPIPVHLHLVGAGKDRQLFENIVQQNNLPVTFHGKIKREKITSFYQNVDAFTFLSLHDSGGMVILEAKLFNLPCVCLNLGGPPSFMSKNDFILEAKNKKQIINDFKQIVHELCRKKMA